MAGFNAALRLARRYPKSSGAFALVVVLAGAFGGEDEQSELKPLAALPSPTATAASSAPSVAPSRPAAPTARATTAAPRPTATRPPAATTKPAAPARATKPPVPRPVVSTRRPPATPALSCAASMSDATPEQYSTTTVIVRTASGADVSATAHYKTTTTTNTGTADGSGTSRVDFRISRATAGYRVVVDVVVSKAGRTASCSTSFVPQ